MIPFIYYTKRPHRTMETITLLLICFVVVSSVLIYPVMTDTIICGTRECRGGSPYCCELDDGTTGCCWDPFVYQMWWFWLIWALVFLLVLACSFRCWQRRRAGIRFVVMNNSAYRNYGTVVHPPRQFRTGGVQPPPPHSYPPNLNCVTAPPPPPPNAPVNPPSYAASDEPNQKPPPYAA